MVESVPSISHGTTFRWNFDSAMDHVSLPSILFALDLLYPTENPLKAWVYVTNFAFKRLSHEVCLRGILVQIEAGDSTIPSGIVLGIGMSAVLVSAVVLEKLRVMEVLPYPRGVTANCLA